MFQLDDEEYDLNEDFLDDIFQLTGPQKVADNVNETFKKFESNGKDIPSTGNGQGQKNPMIEGSPHRHSSGSNSSPVSKKAKFPYDSEHCHLPADAGFLDFPVGESDPCISKNAAFMFKSASDSKSSQKQDREFFGETYPPSIESLKLHNRSPLSYVSNACQPEYQASPSYLRRRKFPGPAGTLPDLDKKKIDPDTCQAPVENVERKYHFMSDTQGDADSTLSQPCAVGSLFGNNSPWAALRQDINLNSSDSSRNPLSKFCLKWARQKATARQLPAHKVPFLAVVIHALDCSSPDPCVILRDPSGEMGGTLHRDVWERHGHLLHPGAAVVLRQIGVLSTGAVARRHYLNITENNLLSIYSSAKMENGPYTFRKGDDMSTNEIKITKIRPLDMNEVKKSLLEMQILSQSSASPPMFSPAPPAMHNSAVSSNRPHLNASSSMRPAPYRSPVPSNVTRFNSQRMFNPAQGHLFGSSPRSPIAPNAFSSSPMQSSGWNPTSNPVSMEDQCSNSPPTPMNMQTSSLFTPKYPAWKPSTLNTPSTASFVPKQPFLNKFPTEQIGSPAGPYSTGCSGASSPNLSLSSPEGSTAMDVSVGPSTPNCEKALNPSSSFFNPKGAIHAESRKGQGIEEAELDLILGGIDTDLLFDDDDF